MNRLLTFLLLGLLPWLAGAANVCVGPSATGSGSGADWNNVASAYALSGGGWVRGNTYYFKQGTYNGSLAFSTTASGSSVITIKSVTTADHGTDTGWNGGSGILGTATILGQNTISTAYWTFDGQTRNSDWRSGYLLHFWNNSVVVGTGNASPAVFAMSGSCNNCTFRYLDVQGTTNMKILPGQNGYDTGGDHAWEGLVSFTDFYVGYCYVHHTGNTQFQVNFDVSQRFLCEYNYVYYNHTAENANHDEAFSTTFSDMTVRFNVFQDICSTGVIVDAREGTGYPIANWDIYGNVFFWDEAYRTGPTGNQLATMDTGVVTLGEGEVYSGFFHFYNNTMANMYNAHMDVQGVGAMTGLNAPSSGSYTATVYNNLWWGCGYVGNLFGTRDYNMAIVGSNGAGNSDWSGAIGNEVHGVTSTSTASPFVNFGAGNLALAAATQAGLSLPAPYNVDLNGNVRGSDGVWDRGAYEFGGAPPGPQAPSIVLQPSPVTVPVGQSAAFYVQATGDAPLAYQWWFGGSAVAGATDTSYTRSNCSTNDNGLGAYCVVTNAVGTATSSTAILTVTPPDTTPPTVSLTGPTAGSLVSGRVPLNATASDNIGVASVQFQVNAVNLGSPVTEPPYFAYWNTMGLPNGTYTLRAVATDTSTNIGYSGNVDVVVTNVLTNGLVGYWTFDEGSGVFAADSSPATNDAMLGFTATWGAPKVGLFSVNFDGQTGMAFAMDAAIQELTSAASLSAWVNHTAIPVPYAWMYYLAKENSGATTENYGYGLYADADGVARLFFEYVDAVGGYHYYTPTNGVGVSTGAWTHVAVTFTNAANGVKFYINGAETGSAMTPTAALGPTTDGLIFGQQNINNYTFPMAGLMDDVRIYNRSLSPVEIAQLAQAQVPVVTAPVITAQPMNATVYASQAVTFSIGVAGSAPLHYAWTFGGSTVGGNAAIYTRSNCVVGDSGRAAQCVVTNTAGSVTSAAAVLTVLADPVIVSQPADTTVNQGSPATFTFGVSGQTPLSYQWHFNGAVVPGVNSSSYTRANCQPSDNGASVYCVATDTAGSVQSSLARLGVISSLFITSNPTNTTVYSGHNATFRVSATSGTAIAYQWYFNGTAVSGATASSYTRQALSPDNGRYAYCLLSDAVATNTSANALLTVLAQPVFTNQPANQQGYLGGTLTFTASAFGADAVAYQWYVAGSPIADATATSFSETAVWQLDGASVYCIGTNIGGMATSFVAHISYTNTGSLLAITAQPSNVLTNEGSNAVFTVAATGLAPLSYQWYFNGAPVGVNASSYSRTAVYADNGEAAQVRVTDSSGSIMSDPATLTVIATPTAGAYFVATNGNDYAPGDVAHPFRTLAKALSVARAGGATYLRGGVFAEHVENQFTPPAGLGSNAPLLYASYPGERATITGLTNLPDAWSEVTAPQVYTPSYPSTSTTNTVLDDGIAGNAAGTVWSIPYDGRPQTAFYVSNSGPNELRVPLHQLGWSSTNADWIWSGTPGNYTKNDLRIGTVGVISTNWSDWSFWWCATNGTTYVRLGSGYAPSNGVIQVSRTIPFYLNWNFVTLDGLTFLGSETMNQAVELPAVAIKTNATIMNCSFEWLDACAVAASQGVVSNNVFKGAGICGFAGSGPLDFQNNLVISNGWRRIFEGASAGVKLISATGIPVDMGGGVYAGNTFGGNWGFGLWFDTCEIDTSDVNIYRNTFTNNAGPGLFLESSGNLSAHYRAYNNLFTSNGYPAQIYGYGDRGCQIQFNTLITETNLGIVWQSAVGRPVPQGNAIANNIIVGTDASWPVVSFHTNVVVGGSNYNLLALNTVDYNCYFFPGFFACLNGNCNMTWAQYTNAVSPYWDRHSIAADPLLTAYVPSLNSPVVKASFPIFDVDTDYAGRLRKTVPDLGALESFWASKYANIRASNIRLR